MSQVYLSVKPMEVQRNISGHGTAASAAGCIDQLQSTFDEIEKTVMELDAVWNDEAQDAFMTSFRQKRSLVALYLGGLKAFIEETNAAVESVKAWDEAMKGRLNSL